MQVKEIEEAIINSIPALCTTSNGQIKIWLVLYKAGWAGCGLQIYIMCPEPSCKA